MSPLDSARHRGRPGALSTGQDFDDFVRVAQAGLVRYATLLCGSGHLGEDLVQDVLVKVYLRWDRIAGDERDVGPYVRRAVTNEFLSWRRRWSTRHIWPVDAQELDVVTVDPPDRGPDPELWQRLLRLPPQQRAALVLRFYEDLDDDEIGAVLGCRAGTVRGHVSRGLAALRRQPEFAPGQATARSSADAGAGDG